MKMKILTAAVISAMLTLTACGETNKADTTSEKPAETTTSNAASEEVTTEAVTEEVTTETTPAVETTVTTTTAATTTTQATTTPAPEPEKEEFKLAEGLSEKYVDFDNMAIEYNGHIFRLGEATVQDFLDAGVELISDDLDSENPSEVEAQVKITDTYIATLYFNRFSGYSKPTGDYILNHCYVKLRDSFSFDVTWGPNYGDGMVHLNIPLVLTMEELIENSGEPVEISNGGDSSVKVCDYRSHSLTYPDDSKFCSEISLTFINNNLAYFHIFANERI